VVYFGEDDSIIKKALLRTEVGIKEINPGAFVCYCVDIFKVNLHQKKLKYWLLKIQKNMYLAQQETLLVVVA
jgi:hypothetical protein